MKIEINFSDIDLADWIDFNGDEPELPKLKEVFKSEVLHQFVSKLNYDFEIRQYVREQINTELHSQIHKYKEEIAIQAVIRSIFEDALKHSGSLIFIDRFKKNVEEHFNELMIKYPSRVEKAINRSMETQLEKIIDELYKGKVMAEFIDINKLSAYVKDTLNSKGLLFGGEEQQAVLAEVAECQ